MDSTQTLFDQAYWAAQPPEVQALIALTDQDQRAAQAAQLASQGFTIDVPIMAWDWDPYLVMTMRAGYGYTWVPSALQAGVQMAPGLTTPGLIPYDPANPPEGSIRVSTNVQDYPPFNPPAQPAPPTPPSNDPVGPQSVGTLYLTVPGDTYPDGAQYTDARGTFLKHVVITPFGRTGYWEKIN